MREMLEPVFGESGAVVAQFLITLVVILLLIGLVYWLVRRFGGVRFNGAGRGRLPRLAVVDALPVDSRRKLVLVRRDNVEHLLLIGGASDVLVEASIQRVAAAGARPRPPQAQQPSPQPAQQAARPAPQAPAPQQPAVQAPLPQPPQLPQRAESTGISEPIPFPPQAQPPRQPARRVAAMPAAASPVEAPPPEPVPQRRAAIRPVPAPAEPLAAVAGPSLRSAAVSGHFEEPTRPTRIESVFALAESLDRIPEPPAKVEEETAGPMEAAMPEPPSEPPRQEEFSDEGHAEAPDISPEPAPAIAMEESADPDETPIEEQDRASKVSDLEREMARLLGEITSRRES